MIDKMISTSRVTEADAVSMRMLGAYQTTSLSSSSASHLSRMFTELEITSTDLTLHPNSQGYKLIMNNVLFPTAKKKKR